jgi:hypothetical protein
MPLTVQLPKSTSLTKLSWKYSQAIIFDNTTSSGIVDTDINLGGAGIKGIFHEFACYSVEASDGDR